MHNAKLRIRLVRELVSDVKRSYFKNEFWGKKVNG